MVLDIEVDRLIAVDKTRLPTLQLHLRFFANSGATTPAAAATATEEEEEHRQHQKKMKKKKTQIKGMWSWGVVSMSLDIK